MGKRRATKSNQIKENYVDSVRVISQNTNQRFYELENYVTDDVAELVAIMMRSKNVEITFWEQKISSNIDLVEPRKALYWLTGGDREWVKLSNYNKPWSEVEFEFENEFKYLINWIVNRSQTLGEIRESFLKYLNLHILYEFAIKINITK